MNKSKIDILIEVNAKTNELLDAQRKVGELRAKLLNMGKMGAAFLGVQVGIQAIGAALKSATAAGIGFNAQLEQQTQALKTLMGSADAARARMADLVKFSAQTPFQLPEIIELDKLLRVLTGGVLSTNEGLKLIGDTAAATGRNMLEVGQQVGRLFIAFKNGTSSAEQTLRLLEMGLMTGELKAELDALALSADAAQRAMGWEKAQQYFTQFNGAMEEQAGTFNGLLSTFRDGLQIIAAAAAEPVFAELKDALAGLVEGLEGGSPRLRIFGQMLADVLRATVALTAALAAAAPYIAGMGALFAAVKFATFAKGIADGARGMRMFEQAAKAVQLTTLGTGLQLAAMNAAAATGALAKMRAGVLGVAAAMRAAFLANPIGIVATAVTAIVAGLWLWRSRQRDVASSLKEAEDAARRMQEAWPARLAAVEDEASQTSLVRDLNEQINLLIKKRSESGLNAGEEHTLALLQQQTRQAGLLTEADRIRNREAAARRRALDAALKSAPESLAKLTAIQPDLRGERDALQAKLDLIPAVDPGALATTREELLKQIGRLAIPAELDRPDWWLSQQEQEQKFAATKDVDAQRTALQSEIEANALLIAQQRERADLTERLAAIDKQLAQETAEQAEQEAAWRAEAGRLTVEGIRQQEEMVRQSFEAQGGSARLHYAQLAAYASARWEREIADAETALAAAETAQEREVAMMRLANAQRGRALELKQFEIDRNRELGRSARVAYNAEIARIQALVQAADEALLSETDVAARTQLESARAALVKEALEKFREYRDEVKGFGLPEAELAEEPDLKEPPERKTRFQRAGDSVDGLGDPTEHYQGAGEGMAGGLLEWSAQFGTIGDQVSEMTGSIASSFTNGIGDAITGVILKTQSWGEALRQIGATILSTVITSLVQMATVEITQRLAVSLFKKKMDAVDVAANASKNAAITTNEVVNAGIQTAAWTPAALVKSIATFGIAALIGVAILAAVMGGFADGGYTPGGPKDRPAGIVHAGEWVAPQWQVRHPVYGPMITRLEQARTGRAMINYESLTARGYADGGLVAMTPPPVGGATAEAGGGEDRRPLTVAFLDDRRIAQRMERDPDVRALIVDLVRQSKAEIFT